MTTKYQFTFLVALAAILAATIGCPPPQSQPQPLPGGSTAPAPGVTITPADVPDAPIPEEPKAEEPAAEPSKVEEPKAEEPKAEEPKAEEPKAEEPKADMPKAEEPKAEEPKAEEPKPEEPKPEEPKEEAPQMETPQAEPPKPADAPAEEPKPDVPATEAPKADAPKEEAPQAEAPKPADAAAASKAELFLKLPEGCNTPDGMCLLADGSIILSMPNFNKLEDGVCLMKITPDNQVEKFLELGKNPGTGEPIGPLGVCAAPSGDLFLADYQMKGKRQSRVLRIPIEDGKPGEPVSAIEGFQTSNAVVCHDGYLYVTETQIDIESDPGKSGIFRFKLEDLDKGVIKLADDETQDPHFLALIEFKNKDVRLGADGLCFDNAGNIYCGNFSDGTLHRIELDDQGAVKSNTIFATADTMKCCDGLFFNPKTEEIYVNDSMLNAIHAVTLDGKVRTLAQNGDTDGLDGGMDQPCEVLLRGNELIVSNMDWPIPGCVNKQYNEPCTLSVIRIPD